MSQEHERALVAERRGSAVWLTLNRPEKLNSISPEVVAGLAEALDGLGPEDRCVVITGRGRAFCAGGDLAAVEGLNGGMRPDQINAFHQSITDVLRRLEQVELPTVCVINGIAVAGGLEIASACDVVVSVDTAVFGDVHANFGLLPGGGGSVRLPRLIGASRAKYLMLTGRTVDAQTMRDWGLVSLVASAEDLDGTVESLITDLTTRSRPGLAHMKRLIAEGLELPVDQALSLEQKVAGEHTGSADYAEGLAAFGAKRQPVFRE